MGNLPNKMGELTSLTRHQRDYRECSIMVLSETWLTELTPDTDANLDGFQLWQADRTAENGKREEEGWLWLLMTVGVTLGTSLLKNRSAVRTLNF